MALKFDIIITWNFTRYNGQVIIINEVLNGFYFMVRAKKL